MSKFRMFEKESKISAEERNEMILCDCGCRIHKSKLNEQGWGICPNCKRKIEDKQAMFKYNLERELNKDEQ